MVRTQTKLLALFPVLSLVFGCLEYGPLGGPERGSVLLTLHAVSSLALVLAWFWIDARDRSYKPSIVLRSPCSFSTSSRFLITCSDRVVSSAGLKALGLSILIFAGTMMAYRVGSLFA